MSSDKLVEYISNANNNDISTKGTLPISKEKLVDSVKDSNQISQNMGKVGMFKKGIYRCEICNKSYKSARYFNLHVRKHSSNNKDESALNITQDASVVNGIFRCEICKKQFAPASCLNHKTKYYCDLCKKELSCEHDYYSCHICKRSFSSADFLNQHTARKHNKDTKYECDVCKKIFIDTESLQQHNVTHSSDKSGTVGHNKEILICDFSPGDDDKCDEISVTADTNISTTENKGGLNDTVVVKIENIPSSGIKNLKNTGTQLSQNSKSENMVKKADELIQNTIYHSNDSIKHNTDIIICDASDDDWNYDPNVFITDKNNVSDREIREGTSEAFVVKIEKTETHMEEVTWCSSGSSDVAEYKMNKTNSENNTCSSSGKPKDSTSAQLVEDLHKCDSSKYCFIDASPGKIKNVMYQNCKICMRVLSSVCCLNNHMLDYHRCVICSKTFANRTTLNKHKWTHIKIVPPTTGNCKDSITNETLNGNCKNKRSPGYDNMCKICDKLFKEARYLNRHMTMKHSENTSVQCDVSKNSFTDTESLHELNVIHSSDGNETIGHDTEKLICDTSGENNKNNTTSDITEKNIVSRTKKKGDNREKLVVVIKNGKVYTKDFENNKYDNTSVKPKKMCISRKENKDDTREKLVVVIKKGKAYIKGSHSEKNTTSVMPKKKNVSRTENKDDTRKKLVVVIKEGKAFIKGSHLAQSNKGVGYDTSIIPSDNSNVADFSHVIITDVDTQLSQCQNRDNMSEGRIASSSLETLIVKIEKTDETTEYSSCTQTNLREGILISSESSDESINEIKSDLADIDTHSNTRNKVGLKSESLVIKVEKFDDNSEYNFHEFVCAETFPGAVIHKHHMLMHSCGEDVGDVHVKEVCNTEDFEHDTSLLGAVGIDNVSITSAENQNGSSDEAFFIKIEKCEDSPNAEQTSQLFSISNGAHSKEDTNILSADIQMTSYDCQRFKCSLCDTMFDTTELLNKHISTHRETVHTNVPYVESKINLTSEAFEYQDKIESSNGDIYPERRENPGLIAECSPISNSVVVESMTHISKTAGITDKGTNKHAALPIQLAPAKCEVCNSMFRSSGFLRNHIKKHLHINDYKCDQCGKVFNRITYLKSHIYHKHSSPHQCTLCKKIFKTEHQLTKHEALHQCDVCMEKFKLIPEVRNHMKTHVNWSRLYKCTAFCDKLLFTRTGMKTHMKMCIKRYICIVCKRGFRLLSDLKTHLLAHSDIRTHRCYVCRKTFKCSYNLKLHLLVHSGGKTYTCDVCRKQFNHRYQLKAHMLYHSAIKPFQCYICKKDFRYVGGLKSHMFYHSANKPFQCDICKKDFRYVSGLKSHMLVHSGMKPHECEVCHKQYSWRSDLNRHMFIHSEIRPHRCNLCQKSFRLSRDLKTHLLVHSE